MGAGLQRASWIRTAWHSDAHIFDLSTAHPASRDVLSGASWVDVAFEHQLVGLRRALAALPATDLARDYAWVMHREAYDYIPEPLSQFVLLSALPGLWTACASSLQQPAAFADMVVRQPSTVLLNGKRSQPIARIGRNSGIGWIYIPYAWDDLLQLSFEALFNVARIDVTQGLSMAYEALARQDPDQADWSPAHEVWNGLCAKAILGRLGVAHDQEHARIADLCDRARVLAPFRMHQKGATGQDLGNSLCHIAKIYTIMHEATHLLRMRQGIEFDKESDAAELDADQMAMLALWNRKLPLRGEVRDGQNENALWLASGLGFYLGLLASGNLGRCVDEAAGHATEITKSTDQHRRAVARFKAWGNLGSHMCKAIASEQQDLDPHRQREMLGPLLRWVVAYCNALLDYGRVVIPVAVRQAHLRLPGNGSA